MIGGDTVHAKVAHQDSVLGALLMKYPADADLVDELYLRTVSRYPDPEEKAAALHTARKAQNRRQGMEDVFWALLNSKEFLYNH
jgi:hypothetical protein